MSRSLVSIALTFAVAAVTGCAPGVNMPVLEPALVNVPSEVQVVAVVDRSAPRNAGQGVIGAIEGVVTGEGVMADREGARQAVNGLVYILQESPRFEVLTPAVDKKQVDSGVFDRAWEYRKVKRLCKEHGCDAVIALEAFDTDAYTRSGLLRDLEEYKDGNDTDFTHYADRETRVLTAWRMYDAHADRTFDQVREHAVARTYQERATSIEAALAKLPRNTDIVRDLGYEAGQDYGRRVAPSWRHVRRTYFAGGSPGLKTGKRYVKARDWDGAVEVWRQEAGSSDHKVRGKALFNMALAAEIDGDLSQALELARKAAVELGNPRSRNYVMTIERRIDDHRRLQNQLAPPPPTPDVADDTREHPAAEGERVTRPDGSGRATRPEGGNRVTRPD